MEMFIYYCYCNKRKYQILILNSPDHPSSPSPNLVSSTQHVPTLPHNLKIQYIIQSILITIPQQHPFFGGSCCTGSSFLGCSTPCCPPFFSLLTFAFCINFLEVSIKLSFTLIAAFAEVSKNSIPFCLAY